MAINATPGLTPASAPAEQAGQYLMFTLGSETFACPIHSIREIIECPAMTAIPLSPAFLRGVINLRGAVVPVIDLGARFSGKVSAVQRRTCIVIVEVQQDDEKHDIGIMVDAVSEVLEIPSADIEPAPAFGARIRADFIAGMGKVAGKFVIILAIQRVLSVDEMAVLAQMGQEQSESQHVP